ncbi:bifunctional demethylmenaquinone methyltransferase/2-methoxy-6-polyprenyl-1,4-benzoquinol methylase UbiE [Phyllobacterium sp. 21LDTY02-6]|uniref:bifunctional demethylmenaquinone methyltransferase/2-methoxy-6-polyprenyl-1,4-benzoquinol methylase UbiE n=1 Tax=unclassified Phyllobacterium TaxID=2638441 RepID=UPI00201FBCA6|nr:MULTISPECIES: bifunctional demethylmenaquinone methyltransferase/2-methoxy-6-polyprenyl-1,4-benzoquinol methylase UbiE [unclassified Phyllobacterium]MCO4317088.1 bifunctional demethylmenaquinone methyltransferase/2-methoxy-6-polyprenyl-1,4-benzoquinol methylase UbiE [Phyllobacterium sp. 21LDTY02-6]MCX8278652.1 bifunctional demethylmenaquinone methyltransferase/2-methoxy-6-polyprenyl-1,4-benzoquinol methylase UbiE [Phyllobacterium sp. 0TCS1.6C]MCX8293518.1 bifunctional demethylmenaquinone meth
MNQQRTGAHGGMETSFGFQNVQDGEKQSRVNDVFHRVAKRYDLMNDLMSGGLHRVWKDSMIAWLSPSRTAQWKVLDVAGGTGDIAFRIIEASQRNAHATILDINGSMLEVGRDRAEKQGLADNTRFVEANAEELPFEDGIFDAYTIAFGIRNVPHIDRALAEAYRVLKPGGRFLCLEFSEVELPVLDKIYDAWSFNAIPKIGKAVTGDADSYQYLVESIRKFPRQADFAEMIRQAGFERVTWRNFTGGIAALHSGWKL